MRNNLNKSVRAYCIRPLLAATIGLALAFTLSCEKHNVDDDNETLVSSSSRVTQSSSGGSSSSANTSNSGTFKDSRDNQTYKWVKIGTQTWMAENLKYDVSESVCYAEGVSGVSADSIAKNCATYGRLYDWATAMGLPSKCNNTLSTDDVDCKINKPHNGICPEGFHIPNNEEWNVLFEFVDNANGGNGESSSCEPDICYESETAGKYLKATSGWNDYNDISGNGLDTYGFAALPGGYGRSNGSFVFIGYYGNWWSSSEYNAKGAYARYIYYNGANAGWLDYETNAYWNYDLKENNLYNIRCLKD